MANNVVNVNQVNEVAQAVGGPAPAVRPSRRNALTGRASKIGLTSDTGLAGLGDLQDVPTTALRSHLQRLPESTPVIGEVPLIETDTAPGFSAQHELTVGRGPIADMSVDPADGLLYVANHADNSVAVLDPVALRVVRIITGISEAFAIEAVDGRAYVSTVDGTHDAISVIDARTTADGTSYPLALTVRDIAVSPDGRFVYAARTGRDGADVAVLDIASGRIVTIDLRTRRSANAEVITLSRDGSRVYVGTADHIGGEFVAIDTASRRVVGGLAFRAPLRDIATGPGGTVFITSGDPVDGGTIDVVDPRRLRVVDSIEIGGPVTQLMVSTEGDRLYVVNGDRITVVCPTTHEIVDTITVVAQPSCIAESVDGKRLFIADYRGAVTLLTVASNTESLLAKMMAADVIDIPMLELESTAV